MEEISQILEKIQPKRAAIEEKYQQYLDLVAHIEFTLDLGFGNGAHECYEKAKTDSHMEDIIGRLEKGKRKIRQLRQKVKDDLAKEIIAIYQKPNQRIIDCLSEVLSDVSEVVNIKGTYFARSEEEVLSIVKYLAENQCCLTEYPRAHQDSPPDFGPNAEEHELWYPKMLGSARFSGKIFDLAEKHLERFEIIEAWHWSPLEPSPNLYRVVMNVVGLISDPSYYTNPDAPVLGFEEINGMKAFMNHFTSIDPKHLRCGPRLNTMMGGPELIGTVYQLTS
tara:strand:+ start:389 stop:1225 length:837 start_codon:yes stop_codon:yes gene_type:complete